jgi:hypothetical protein
LYWRQGKRKSPNYFYDRYICPFLLFNQIVFFILNNLI